MDSHSSRGITLVLDPDEAGQKSAETSGLMLMDLFGDWGVPRYTNEPESHVVAQLQHAIDDTGDTIKALEAFGRDASEDIEMRVILWDYMDSLMTDERLTVYSKVQTAEELEHLLVVIDNPILPEHGRIDYEAIKQNVDIADYIGRDTDLRRSGHTLRTRCPLGTHSDSSPSFYVYPDTKSFYCFGCNVGGDVIKYAELRGVRAAEIA